MQAPHFRAAGLDLSPYHPATLNVDLAPHVPGAPARPLFDRRLRWHGDLEERFVLALAVLRCPAGDFEGLWYWPDPATKPDHFQAGTVVELLLPWVPGLATGAPVQVALG